MAAEKFSEAKLLDCLNERGSAFTAKFKGFREQYLKHNQDWIHKSIKLLKRQLLSNEIQPMSKIHIIKILKDCFETGFYPIVILIEVEILPVLRQIGLYKKASTDQNRGKTYFTDDLPPEKANDPKLRDEHEKIGNSYLRFVLECIEVWAQLKPWYYLADIEVREQPSAFSAVYNELKAIEKVTFPDKRTYFPEEAVAKARVNFRNMLEDLLNNTVNYVDYYTIVLAEALEKAELMGAEDIKLLRRLQQHPDVMLVEEATKILRDNLESKATPSAKIHSLQLLNDMFEDGLLEVVHQAEQYLSHMEAYLGTLDPKETSLKRGDRALPVEPTVSSKYYCNMLKSLVCWSQAVPKDLFDLSRESKFRAYYQRLSKKYEFPYISEQEIRRFRNNYLNNSKKMAAVNHVIFQQLNDERKSRMSNSSIKERAAEFEKPSNSRVQPPEKRVEIPPTAFQKQPSGAVLPPKSNQPSSGSKLIEPSSRKQLAPVIPKSLADQHIQTRFNVLDEIYKYIESATIATEAEEKEWLKMALGYCQSYNNTYEEYMEGNLEMSNFDDLFDRGYSYFGVNEKLVSIFGKTSLSYADKLKHAKAAIANLNSSATPGGAGNSSAIKQDIEMKKVDQPVDTGSAKKLAEEVEAKRKLEQERKRAEEFERRNQEEENRRRQAEAEAKRQRELEQQKRKDEAQKRERESRDRKKAEDLEEQKSLQAQRQIQIQKQQRLQLERQQKAKEERERQQEEQKRRQVEIAQLEQKRREAEQNQKRDLDREKTRQAALIKSNGASSSAENPSHALGGSILEKSNLIMNSARFDEQKLGNIQDSGSAINLSAIGMISNITKALPQESMIEPSNIRRVETPPVPHHIRPMPPPSSAIPSFQQATSPKFNLLESSNPSQPSAFSFTKHPNNKVYDAAVPNQINYKPQDHELEQNQQNIVVEEEEGPGKKIPKPNSAVPVNKLSNMYQNIGVEESPPKPHSGVNVRKLDLNGAGSQQNKTESKQSSIIHALNRPSPAQTPLRFMPERNGELESIHEAQHSEILEPNLEPLNQSFHDVDFKDFYSQISSAHSPNFKNCFEFDKFLIPNRTVSGKEKVFWLEQDAQILNPISKAMKTEPIRSNTSQGFYPRKSTALEKSMYSNFVTLPQLLAERTEKFDGELKLIQDRHRKEVDMLENKIKRLEKELREKDRVVKQQQMEIMSMKEGGDTSRAFVTHPGGKAISVSPQKAEYLQQENQLLKSRLKQKQSYTSGGYEPSWVGLSPAPMTPLSHGIENSIQRFKESMKQPKGRLFFADPFQPYLSVISEPRLKKLMLKNKELLFQNDHIEIGAIISLDTTLKIALYIQSTAAVADLVINLSKSANIKASWYPEKLPLSLQPGKQQRIIYSLELLQLPYHVPQLEFSYTVGGSVFSNSALMPCTFNKFVQSRDTDPEDFNHQFQQLPEASVIRGAEILYNKKLLKEPKSFDQLIPKIRLLNPYDEKDFIDGRSNLRFGLIVSYNKATFLIKANIRPNQSLFFQGACLSGSDPKPLEFLINTFNCLLSRQKQWS